MKNIIVTISEEHLNDLDSITESMVKDGMIINITFVFGVVWGQADEETIQKLKKRKELSSVMDEKKVSIIKEDITEEDKLRWNY
jgi:hypothetical protein